MTRHQRVAALATLAAVMLAPSACSSPPLDRTGSSVLVLHFATIDGFDLESAGRSFVGPQTFVRELHALSDGHVQVDVTTSYRDGARGAESGLVRAIASGDLDGGWPATRAFAAAGIDGLQPIEAPFELVNRDAVNDLLTGGAAGDALHALDHTGVVGLGLAAGGLRRPFATTPLLSRQDWTGVRFRTFNSPVQAAAVTALGARPMPDGPAWVDDVELGKLDGGEFSLETYLADGYTTQVPQVTANAVLWPKVFVLTMNRRRYDSLDDMQRRWIDQAAAQAVQASRQLPDDGHYVPELCDRGVRFHQASAAQLDQLTQAVTPVIYKLRHQATTGALMADIEAIARRHPTPDSPTRHGGCADASSPSAGHPSPSSPSALPPGVYRTQVTLAALTRAGIDNGPGFTGIWTLTVQDGTYALTCRPVDAPGRDCGNSVSHDVLEAGHLRSRDQSGPGRIYFVADRALLAALSGCSTAGSATADQQCPRLDTYSALWRLDGDQLTFTDPTGPYSEYLGVRAWTRVAAD